MIDISTEFKNEMFNDNRNFLPFLDITLKDGTILNLSKEDIWQNSFKVEDATSANGTFSIGAAVTGKLNVTLNNIYDDFSEYDFADAQVVAYVGLQLSNTLEKPRVGIYTVDEPSYDGTTITLSCLDYMSKFDKPYTASILKYPATLGAILRDACQCCGISLVSSAFDNSEYVVSERPKDEALTFGDIVACVAQIAGKWAKMDEYGRLYLDWYKISVFEQNANLNGGIFDNEDLNSYLTGDDAEGGDFTDFSSGVSEDGGTFYDQKQYHHIFSTKSFSMSTDDVVITGVRVTEDFEETETEKPQIVLVGSEGYIIEVSGNPLIQKGKARSVANYLYSKVGGMRFRPLTVETLANPAIEAGDIAYVTDRKQNAYQTFISNRVFNLGGAESITCDAETPSRNNAKTYSDMTKAVVKARNETKKQLGTYDLAVQQLTNLMAQSFGVFKSEEVLEDGSVIYYLHNKPERTTSSTIWKMTADAFAVSTDGGKSWNAGIDSNGNAVVNVLNAIGINANWINAGSLILGGKQINEDGTVTVYDKNGAVLFKVNKDKFYVDTENFRIDENADVFMRNPYVQSAVYMNINDNATQKSNYREIIGQYLRYGVYGPKLKGEWYSEGIWGSFFKIDSGDGYGCSMREDGVTIYPLAVNGAKTDIDKDGIRTTGAAYLQSLKTTSFSFDTYGVLVKDVNTGADMTTKVSGTLRQSGVFVLMTGKIVLKDLVAGDTESIDLTESGTDKQPLTPSGAYFPNHRGVATVGYLGTRVFVIKLSTAGVLSIRNCGSDYENSNGGEIYFRFDYTLM